MNRAPALSEIANDDLYICGSLKQELVLWLEMDRLVPQPGCSVVTPCMSLAPSIPTVSRLMNIYSCPLTFMGVRCSCGGSAPKACWTHTGCPYIFTKHFIQPAWRATELSPNSECTSCVFPVLSYKIACIQIKPETMASKTHKRCLVYCSSYLHYWKTLNIKHPHRHTKPKVKPN